MVKLISEAVSPNGFYSPIKLQYPKILVKRSSLIEIYEFASTIDLQLKIQYEERNVIYDYIWIDNAYLTLIKDHPMQLRSSIDCKLSCKYPVYNHLCEIKSPYCACVHLSSIYTALGNAVHKFDIETGTDMMHTITQNLKPRTVINTICIDNKLLALGSYNSEVYLIDTNTSKLITILKCQENGVIQCMVNNNYLYVGGRKDNTILLWDIRKISTPVYTYYRDHPTNQKILFDVNDKNWLMVGNHDGSVKVYNLVGEPVQAYYAHFDAVNSVQFSPTGSINSSGQRHYNPPVPLSLIRVWED